MLTVYSPAVSQWTMDSLALPNPTATYQIAFTGDAADGYGIVLDDITIAAAVIITEPCEAPTGLTATNVENHTISIAWDANTGVNSWNIRYRDANGDWTIQTSSTNSHTITGLEGLTTYVIQVQANCGDNGLSEWSNSITVQTTNVGIEDHLLNSISLYPNPANDVVNVQCTMNNVQLESVEVIDVYGKVVRTVVGANNHSPMSTRINVSGLANGMYFVRVTTDEGVATKPFVVKR